jgi:peptidoglycan/LPS O-acetylase OafA/YrhL
MTSVHGIAALNAKSRIDALTGLRGVAAWLVVAYHFRSHLAPVAAPGVMVVVGGGYLAVDVFFVLSGFVIWLNYADRFQRPSIRALAGFLIARLGRVYPLHLFLSILYLMTFMVILEFSAARDTGERYGLGYYLLSLALLHNWGFTGVVGWNVPSWSISTEWFAYLVFPAVALAVLRWMRRPAPVVIAAAALAALAAMLFALVGAESLGERIPAFGLPRCLLEFLIGVALGRLYALAGPAPAWALPAALALAVTAVLGKFPDFVVAPAASALLVYGLTARTPLSPLLENRVALYLGEISYSTYLGHYLVKDWVTLLLVEPGGGQPAAFAVYVAVTAAISVLLYHGIELPAQALVRKAARRRFG